MRTWRMACSAAVLAIGLATAAHADEWTKLTYLTFSGPVNMPGITLPGGTYRFELMDPDASRRVIRVSDKDGSKNYGIFLTMSDQKMEPSSDPVVMFKEMPQRHEQLRSVPDATLVESFVNVVNDHGSDGFACHGAA